MASSCEISLSSAGTRCLPTAEQGQLPPTPRLHPGSGPEAPLCGALGCELWSPHSFQILHSCNCYQATPNCAFEWPPNNAQHSAALFR